MESQFKFRAFFKCDNLELMLHDVALYPSGSIGITVDQLNEALKDTGWDYLGDGEFALKDIQLIGYG